MYGVGSVIPTRVGMVRSRSSFKPTCGRDPHARGDGPSRENYRFRPVR